MVWNSFIMSDIEEAILEDEFENDIDNDTLLSDIETPDISDEELNGTRYIPNLTNSFYRLNLVWILFWKISRLAVKCGAPTVTTWLDQRYPNRGDNTGASQR